MKVTITGRKATTVNVSRRMHFRVRAEDDKFWRQAAWAAAYAPRRKPMRTPVIVIATPLHRGGNQQDPGACYPAVKAALDGIVDAKVIPGDTAEFVAEIRMRPPRRCDTDGLELELVEATDAG